MAKRIRRSTENRNKIKELYESGNTFEEISAETGYKVSSIKTILCSLSVRYGKDNNEAYAKALQMRKDGKLIKDISKEVGINEGSLSTYFCKNGLRTKGEDTIPKEETNVDYADIESLSHAQPRMARIYNDGGKKWVDVTEKLFEQPEILMLRG